MHDHTGYQVKNNLSISSLKDISLKPTAQTLTSKAPHLIPGFEKSVTKTISARFKCSSAEQEEHNPYSVMYKQLERMLIGICDNATVTSVSPSGVLTYWSLLIYAITA